MFGCCGTLAASTASIRLALRTVETVTSTTAGQSTSSALFTASMMRA